MLEPDEEEEGRSSEDYVRTTPKNSMAASDDVATGEITKENMVINNASKNTGELKNIDVAPKSVLDHCVVQSTNMELKQETSGTPECNISPTEETGKDETSSVSDVVNKDINIDSQEFVILPGSTPSDEEKPIGIVPSDDSLLLTEELSSSALPAEPLYSRLHSPVSDQLTGVRASVASPGSKYNDSTGETESVSVDNPSVSANISETLAQNTETAIDQNCLTNSEMEVESTQMNNELIVGTSAANTSGSVEADVRASNCEVVAFTETRSTEVNMEGDVSQVAVDESILGSKSSQDSELDLGPVLPASLEVDESVGPTNIESTGDASAHVDDVTFNDNGTADLLSTGEIVPHNDLVESTDSHQHFSKPDEIQNQENMLLVSSHDEVLIQSVDNSLRNTSEASTDFESISYTSEKTQDEPEPSAVIDKETTACENLTEELSVKTEEVAVETEGDCAVTEGHSTIGKSYLANEESNAVIEDNFLVEDSHATTVENDSAVEESFSAIEEGDATIDGNTDNTNLVAVEKSEDCEVQLTGRRAKGIKRKLEIGALPNSIDLVSKKSASSKKSTKKSLPKCKMTRTYVCEYCNLSTQNPRDHLYHIRDVHFEAIHIYECKSCQYASKNFTKLTRHMQMVHKMNLDVDENGIKRKILSSSYEAPSPAHVKESLLSTTKKTSKSSKALREGDEQQEFVQELGEELEDEEEYENTKKDDVSYQCDHCEFVGKSQKSLSKHEESCHLKRTFYRCSKCAYATQLKGRYTKHMKYHQLPIIKCDYCDFRTPYRWNLDRHCRNHTDETGEHKCHLCNFTAQIKQSLTVHVANHHLTPEQIKERDLKRNIGVTGGDSAMEFATDEEEMELMKMERDEHPDAFHLADDPDQSFTVAALNVSCNDESSSSLCLPDDQDTSTELKKKKPKIKMTFRKMKNSKDSLTSQEINERHNFEEDFIHPDDFVHRNGNVYMKNYKCDQCPFKAAFKNDLIRHGKKVHDIPCEVSPVAPGRKVTRSSSLGSISAATDPESLKNESMDGFDFKDTLSPDSMNEVSDSEFASHSKISEGREHRKKSTSDDSHEKPSSAPNAQNLVCQYCNHNSKCLAESVRHAKLHLSVKNTPTATSVSTRCQFCRLQCKSTDVLAVHLKKCQEARKNQIIDSAPRRSRLDGHKNGESDEDENDDEEDDDDEVDVDNQQNKNNEDIRSSETAVETSPIKNWSSSYHATSDDESASSRDTEDNKLKIDIKEEELEIKEEASSLSTPGMVDDEVDVRGGSAEKRGSDVRGYVFSKRAYLCPQCKFWSTTASRFHVHIVGHYNKKPYVCSVCPYRSNWRWDITKHIKIKSGRDKSHLNADVLITDETGEKNYEKYEKYVSIIQLDETQACRTEGGIPPRKGRLKKVDRELRTIATDDGVEDSCGSTTSSTRYNSASSREDTPVMSPNANDSSSNIQTNPGHAQGRASPAQPKQMQTTSKQRGKNITIVPGNQKQSQSMSLQSPATSKLENNTIRIQGSQKSSQKSSSQPMVCIPINCPMAMSTPVFPGLPRLVKPESVSSPTTLASSASVPNSTVTTSITNTSVTAFTASSESGSALNSTPLASPPPLTSTMLSSALFQNTSNRNLPRISESASPDGASISSNNMIMKLTSPNLDHSPVLPPPSLAPAQHQQNGCAVGGFKQPIGKNLMKPPPLLPVRRLPSPSSSTPSLISKHGVVVSRGSAGGQCQSTTAQSGGAGGSPGSLSATLETLQILAAGCTSVTKFHTKTPLPPMGSPKSGSAKLGTTSIGSIKGGGSTQLGPSSGSSFKGGFTSLGPASKVGSSPPLPMGSLRSSSSSPVSLGSSVKPGVSGPSPTSLSSILAGAGSTSASISSLVALANAVSASGRGSGMPPGNPLSLLNNLSSSPMGIQSLKDALPSQLLAGLSSANENDPSNKLALQMRVLVWLSLIHKEAQKKQQQQQQQQQQKSAAASLANIAPATKPPSASASCTPSPASSSSAASAAGTPLGGRAGGASLGVPSEEGRPSPQLVLDHQGKPEWKCAVCSFRDSDRSTVEQHRTLAHGRSVVSLLHAVHRCDVCAFAAGTKRHVQLHIDTDHGGRGGITSSCEGESPAATAAASGTWTVCYLPCLVVVLLAVPCGGATCRALWWELFEHLVVHGVQVPSSLRTSVDSVPRQQQQQLQQQRQQEQHQEQQQSRTGSDTSALYQCGACPFESHNRTKVLHHRQFHRPRGLAFKCPQCSYNVTRRHLLAQHIRVHGLPPETLEKLFGSNGPNPELPRDRSDSPSPSLTITPINGSGDSIGSSMEVCKGASRLSVMDFLPVLLESATVKLLDVPMVWTSKGERFFKMFKCRWCPHVNLRKTNVQDHEKMHFPSDANSTLPEGAIKCPYCSYVSVNVNIITAHVKVHEGTAGKIHAFVDPAKSDEEQIHRLKSQAMMNSLLHKAKEANKAEKIVEKQQQQVAVKDEKMIYCCQLCPARFFVEKEILIHTRFHGAKFNQTFVCEKCDYGARQEPHLSAHVRVHSSEYQENTRNLLTQYKSAALYPPVPGLSIPATASPGHSAEVKSKEAAAVSKDPSGVTRFRCSLCPSTFSKQITLQYHQSLHGANNPFKCDRCTYAAKTQDALNQHVSLHQECEKKSEKEEDKLQKNEEHESTEKEEERSESSTSNELSCTVQPNDPGETNASGNVLQPPIKMKFTGLKSQSSARKVSTSIGSPSSISSSCSTPSLPKKQFKYYVEEQVPLSGVDLLRHKTQMEQQQLTPKTSKPEDSPVKSQKSYQRPCKDQENEAKRLGDPDMHYPLHVDKMSGKTREKRYKCKLCPSAFEKIDQYNVHANLHGADHKYKCRICDYSVKFFANFNMHINRHKYNERVESKKTGKAAPEESDARYEPIIHQIEESTTNSSSSRETSVTESSQVDLTTAERQHILIQNKKGLDSKTKEDDSKRVFYCQYCPYANVRRDAVDSHSLRHIANGGKGLYKCNFCDYIASQPNFIKDHTKVHFKPFKYVIPEGYIRHDQQDLFSVELVTEGQPEPKVQEKMNIFSHKNGSFGPVYRSPGKRQREDEKENVMTDPVEVNTVADPAKDDGIVIDYSSGEVIEAPPSYVITLKPSYKSKCREGPHTDSDHSTDAPGKSGRESPEGGEPPPKKLHLDLNDVLSSERLSNFSSKSVMQVDSAGSLAKNGSLETMDEGVDLPSPPEIAQSKSAKSSDTFLGFESPVPDNNVNGR
ncbi:Zinc finger C2H2-type [Trinorchestia longiramus]|nr:Zinc finger C2H2-type [Trinorchestia longiramus]